MSAAAMAADCAVAQLFCWTIIISVTCHMVSSNSRYRSQHAVGLTEYRCAGGKKTTGSKSMSMSSLLEAIDQLSEFIENETRVILSDFNAKNSEWKSIDRTDNNGRQLQSAFLRHGLSVANKQQGTRSNLLSNATPLPDIISTNIPHMLSLAEPLSPVSDHCPAKASFHVSTLHSLPHHCTNVRKN